jgi:para-nitrobenzyl esterase
MIRLRTCLTTIFLATARNFSSRIPHLHARLCLAAVILAALLSSPAAVESKPPSTRIESGQVSGIALGEKKDIHVYKGIPYAGPPVAPVGDLRWKPPQPAKAWEGVRACTEFGPACPQPKVFIISDDIKQLGEDCLQLNAWAPAQHRGKRLPVMVWIHGGAYVLGATCQTWFNGESLARKGVVVVTINYRLGPLGFLAHPLLSKESEHGVSGNYGLLDQLAALAWVKRNIAAFGGDPNCVTIFGESAGAGSVCHLLVSPLAKGLFQRAIAESGGARSPTSPPREMVWQGTDGDRRRLHRQELGLRSG